jgi:hypothetical protein
VDDKLQHENMSAGTGTGHHAHEDDQLDIDFHGWRILNVMPHSPSSGHNIIPYFECITHINNEKLSADENTLVNVVKENEPCMLTLFHLGTQKIRDIRITPSSKWGGVGLLGLMIRYDNMTNYSLECIHVLDVYPASPASDAGLHSNDDYLLGTSSLPFKGYQQLDFWLEEHEGR